MSPPVEPAKTTDTKNGAGRARSARGGRSARESGSDETERAHDLLAALVEEVERADAAEAQLPASGPGRGVVVELVLDGFRYVLAREPLTERRPAAALSSREREIARMIAAGHTNKTVASVLDISSWTVSTHLRRIFAKLDVTSRAQMVAKLLEDGVLGQPIDASEGPYANGL